MNVGIIGYGVRIDMLIDAFKRFDSEFTIKAITDKNIPKVKALLDRSDVPEEVIHKYELDKLDAKLRETKLDTSLINFYEDADEMLDKEKLDGVLVGTNCDTHVKFACKVLERDLPLFLEKPVATATEDLKKLKEAAAVSKSEVVVSFPLRVTNLIREVKKIVDSGIISKVEQVQAWNDVPYGMVYFHDWYRDERITHGLFMQKATHDIDVINYLVGEEPLKVCAMKSKQIFKGDMPAGLKCEDCDRWETCTESPYYLENFRNEDVRNQYCCFASDTGNEDSGSLILKYKSGMHATYSQNFFARKGAGRRGGRLYGYKGTIQYEFSTDEIIIYDHLFGKKSTIKMDNGGGLHGGGDYALAYNFIEVMKKKAKSESPLDAGILSALVCLKATESAKDDVFCDLEF